MFTIDIKMFRRVNCTFDTDLFQSDLNALYKQFTNNNNNNIPILILFLILVNAR